ncbi:MULTISPECIES: hypothetical protein [Helcococcus]|uniref:Uncharacterized protein n=1 Tax=Helcococcus bovis TaxID=3153252 RepID=A0ABW9F521_9FIRM
MITSSNGNDSFLPVSLSTAVVSMLGIFSSSTSTSNVSPCFVFVGSTFTFSSFLK